MKNTEYQNNQRTPKERKRIIAVIIVAIIIVVGLLTLCFKGCSNDTPTETNSGIVYDKDAVEGGWDETDADKIRESLNQKVAEGMINISMNTSPVFESGTSSGNLMIVNETINNYPQKVIITRNDTDGVIYESDAVAVGKKIENAKLDIDLSAGTYECTAYFYNLNPETGESIGCAGAEITVTVLK